MRDPDKPLHLQSKFRRYLSRQFSIAFDVYLQILSNVDSLVNEALHRDSPSWHLKHCCPACTYILQGEQPLKFSMLYALDGNDSLKRVQRKLLSEDGEANSISIELPTSQVLSCPRYLSRDFVDQQVGHSSNTATAEVRKLYLYYLNSDLLNTQDAEMNPCAGRWKNMDDQKTKKTWGVYDETGIVLAVCRHGFLLQMVDMVQSGEL